MQRHEMRRRVRQARTAAGFAVATLACPTWLAARADDAAAAPPAPAAVAAASEPATQPDKPAAQLTEVVVTATKRSKSLRDIPASITSIPGKELEQRNAQGVQDIVKLVPGVNYTSAGDSPPRVTMRGISADPATSFTSGTLFGDVSFTDEYVPLVALDPNPFDLKSVDVMKGPQGTLFGASALNGAIRYVPEPPRYGVWQTRYFAQYTRIWSGGAAPVYGAVLNLPLGGRDDLALRLTGFERETPGYIDNIRTGVKDANRVNQAGARGILGWTPLEPLEVNLSYAWQNTHVGDSSVADNETGQLSNSTRPRPSPNHTNYTLGNLALRYDLGWAQAVSDSAYVHKSNYNFFDASSRLLASGQLPLLAQIYNSHSDTWSQELRLVSPAAPKAPWQWVTGLFWSRQRIYDRLDVPVGDSSLPLGTLIGVLNGLVPGLGSLATGNQLDLITTQPDVTVKELAWFGDVTRRLGPVELSVGGRLYRTVSEGTARQGGLLIEALSLNPQRELVGLADQKGFSPKLSALWHLTGNVMTYAAAARGFRVGGVQAGITVPVLSPVQAPSAFKSDSIWNYEGGLRTEWFHKTLRLDLTGYYERWKNPQTLQYDSTGLSSYVDNVGGVKSLGGEAALQMLLPLKGLMLSASGSYSDTVTTKPFTGADGSTVAVGTRWPFAPFWQTATTLAYITDLGDWNLNGALTHVYLGKANNNLTQQDKIFGYQQWDFLFSLDNKAWRWLPEFSVAANNLLDSRGVVNHVYSSKPPQTYSDVTYVQPRSLTLRLSGRF